jgi:hypothetical protein
MALWLRPVTWIPVLGQELAAAGEPLTSIQAQIIPIAPKVFLDLST